MNNRELIEVIYKIVMGCDNPEARTIKTIKQKKVKKKVRATSLCQDELWQQVRKDFIDNNKHYCAECKKKLKRNEIQLDHILPKSKYPDLVYELTNLRIVCWPCNRTKAAHRIYLL